MITETDIETVSGHKDNGPVQLTNFRWGLTNLACWFWRYAWFLPAPQNPNEIGCNLGYSQLFNVKQTVLPSYGELIYAWCLGGDVPYPWTGLNKW